VKTRASTPRECKLNLLQASRRTSVVGAAVISRKRGSLRVRTRASTLRECKLNLLQAPRHTSVVGAAVLSRLVVGAAVLSRKRGSLRVRTRASTPRECGSLRVRTRASTPSRAVDANNLTLIRPIFCRSNQSRTYGILLYVLPFLGVTFIIAQNVIEETRLPKRSLGFGGQS